MTDNITLPRQTVQQALEALASYSIGERLGVYQVNDLIAELKAALEQQAEPVAWMTHSHDLLPLFHRTERAALVWGAEPTPLYTAPPQQQAEPVQKPKYMAQSNGRHSPLLTHMMNKRTALAEPEQSFEDEQRVINADNHRRANALEEAIHAAWSAGYVEGEKAVLEQQAEPVGEVIDERGEVDYISYVPPVGTALYTTPPQRKELSESEILNMMPSTIPAEYDGELMEFARAVETKIKEGT